MFTNANLSDPLIHHVEVAGDTVVHPETRLTYGVPSGPTTRASHSKKSSSETGPATNMLSSSFSFERSLYSLTRLIGYRRQSRIRWVDVGMQSKCCGCDAGAMRLTDGQPSSSVLCRCFYRSSYLQESVGLFCTYVFGSLLRCWHCGCGADTVEGDVKGVYVNM